MIADIDRFIDAVDVEYFLQFADKLFVVIARDGEERKLWKAIFINCREVNVKYACDDLDEDDLTSLTEGIVEMPSPELGIQRYQMGFVMDAYIEVKCERLEITRIE